ncbi:MAG: radical SAM protein [Candidatus Binatia bacterium]|nr:MAG: radical SAM protein [Candidatus Binatia bacterium]
MFDFERAPFLVIWEATQACDLACTHCRASARPQRDPGELDTEEAKALLSEIAAMGTRVVVLSGGDPLKRPDIFGLVRHAKDAGLRVATIPSATPALERDVVFRLRDEGLDQIALSLDFPDPRLHDSFRGTPGAFRKTMEAAGWAREAGLPLQINTTVWARSFPHFPALVDLLRRLEVVFWEVFFLVPVGRGATLEGLDAELCERIFGFLHAVQKNNSFVLKVVEAPQYRRFVWQRENGGKSPSELPPLLVRKEGPGRSLGLAPAAVNAGKGFAFVSHTGEVYPSGFLPLSAGNVRTKPFSAIYRDSPLFRAMRDPGRLLGRCGRCEFRELCGGSRSRAFALTGNPFATDPWCAYRPSRHSGSNAACN